MEACGMSGFRFHDLRHTLRTQGAEAGVPLEVMMAQLGHMDRETSLEYVHIQQSALERAKQLIESEQAEIVAVARKSLHNLSPDRARPIRPNRAGQDVAVAQHALPPRQT